MSDILKRIESHLYLGGRPMLIYERDLLAKASDEIKRLKALIDGQETERTIREAYIRKLEKETSDAGEGLNE